MSCRDLLTALQDRIDDWLVQVLHLFRQCTGYALRYPIKGMEEYHPWALLVDLKQDILVYLSLFTLRKLLRVNRLYVYRILPNKRTCLNKCAPRLLTLSGHISETTEPICSKFSALIGEVFMGPHNEFH